MLHNLPVTPDTDGGDDVVDAYMRERDAISSPQDLVAFTKRWRPLYEMEPIRTDTRSRRSRRYRFTMKHYRQVLSASYDPVQVFACLEKLRAGRCEHGQKYSCAGMHVMLPIVMLRVMLLAEEFGVSTNMALIQASGGLGALERR